MNVEELRLGNLLQVEAFNPTTMEFAKVTSIKLDEVECEDQRGTTLITRLGLTVKDYGIPLTEEWLLKFGFTNEKGDDVWNALKLSEFENVFWLPHYFVTNEDSLRDDTYQFYERTDEDTYWVIHYRLQYVHQLQNLYFALTGNELLTP